MTINVSMTNPDEKISFNSDHQLRFQTGDNRTCLMVSGTVRLNFSGSRNGWRKTDCLITVRVPAPPNGKVLKLESWVPTVNVNGFQNDNHAVNLGISLESFGLGLGESDIQRGNLISNTITFKCKIGVRDVDDRISRLSYHATLLGHYVDTPPVNLI